MISIALEEEQCLSPQHWVDWIRSIPALVKYANIEGIYKSNSTLILIAIPIAIWNLVPANPAISFIGFSKSRNLLISLPCEGDATAQELQAGAVAELTGQETEIEVSHRARDTRQQMLREAKNTELKKLRLELQESREKYKRVWESLDRMENEELNRIQSLRSAEPIKVGGIWVASRWLRSQRASKERSPSHAPPTDSRTDDSSSESSSSLDRPRLRMARSTEVLSTADGPLRKNHPMSRKGCRTCNRRHIRCDESFPQWYVWRGVSRKIPSG